MKKLIKGILIVGFSIPYIVIMENLGRFKKKKTTTHIYRQRYAKADIGLLRPATNEVKRNVVYEC